MKVVAIIVLILIFTNLFLDLSIEEKKPQLIRLHVIANSNSKEDQDLKYRVRDEIVKSIKNEFQGSKSIDESRHVLLDRLPKIESIAEGVIKKTGKDYDVVVKYGDYPFPTKYYGDFSLPAGDYEAVRVIIGSGNGKNWWCVLFPPLCFVEGHTNKVMAQDKIKKVIDKSLEQKKVIKIKPAFKTAEILKNIKAKIYENEK